MFREQIEQLTKNFERICDEIENMEIALKNKKEEMRDVKQAIASLERIQSKYEVVVEEVLEEATE